MAMWLCRRKPNLSFGSGETSPTPYQCLPHGDCSHEDQFLSELRKYSGDSEGIHTMVQSPVPPQHTHLNRWLHTSLSLSCYHTGMGGNQGHRLECLLGPLTGVTDMSGERPKVVRGAPKMTHRSLSLL